MHSAFFFLGLFWVFWHSTRTCNNSSDFCAEAYETTWSATGRTNTKETKTAASSG